MFIIAAIIPKNPSLQLIKSMEKLANYQFEWVLPGHGRRYHADKETMQKQMEKCVDWMKTR